MSENVTVRCFDGALDKMTLTIPIHYLGHRATISTFMWPPRSAYASIEEHLESRTVPQPHRYRAMLLRMGDHVRYGLVPDCVGAEEQALSHYGASELWNAGVSKP